MGEPGGSVFVIDQDGKVAYSESPLQCVDPSSYSDLKQAVQAARQVK